VGLLFHAFVVMPGLEVTLDDQRRIVARRAGEAEITQPNDADS